MNTEICPNCKQLSKKYDATFDFWQCESCLNVWSDGLGDPDYDDDTEQALEVIADLNIARLQSLPARDHEGNL